METPRSLDFEACYRAVVARDARYDGRFFTGVTSTGIYCRPVCPARTPHRENMTFHPSAAAAEAAGFRACLRCRPETAPDMGAWNGTSNTVSRALRLIEAGALDGDGDVEALADRLGVGERQLRRLFQTHLGAAPVSVAQTRRVLLAKALIQETGMPLAEVALAAGFGSVRRFNETFQALYGRAPSSLRRGGVVAGAGAPVRLTLRWRPPYDWSSMRGALAARGEVIEADGAWMRVVEGQGGGRVRAWPVDRHRLAVEVELSDLRRLPGVLARVRAMFDLAADPEAIAAHLSEDAALASLVHANPGLRVPGDWVEADEIDATPASDRFEGGAAAVARAEPWRPWRAYAVAHLMAVGRTVDDLIKTEMRDAAA